MGNTWTVGSGRGGVSVTTNATANVTFTNVTVTGPDDPPTAGVREPRRPSPTPPTDSAAKETPSWHR